MPDITTGLRLLYRCSDAADGTISDSGPDALNLTVTASGAFPTRTTADGKLSRRFSRTAAETPSNYGLKTITSAQFQSIVGANNGHRGENTIAAWVRRSTSDTGAGNGDCIFGLTGNGNGGVTADIQILSLVWQRFDDKFHVVAYASDLSSFSWTSAFALTSFDVWHHIAVVTRNNVPGVSYFFDLYIDGVLVETSPSRNATFALAGVYPAGGVVIAMGAESLTNGTVSQAQTAAYLSSVCAFSRALAATDVATLVTATIPVGVKSIAVDAGKSQTKLAVDAGKSKTNVAVDAAKSQTTLTVDAAKSKSTVVLP